ncbi:hypothetical protein [Polaribacter sp. Asnod1-A03]|uniref:hypothetical protein n=1 Tax=Polaribacter sp. Asnod1-A03 TaxID=3160581 RepID=UPI00386F2D7A
MKKIKHLKLIFFLFLGFCLSSCEEGGPIQFIVVDEFESGILEVKGQEGESGFSVTESADISGLIENSADFVEAEIEEVRIVLKDDYSGNPISLSLHIVIDGETVVDQDLILEQGVEKTLDLTESVDILNSITSGNFPFVISGTSASPLEDNDFTINMIFKVKATVE